MSSAYRKVTRDGYLSGAMHVLPKRDYAITDLIHCIENDSDINSEDKGFDRRTVRSVLVRLNELNEMPLFGGTNEIDVRQVFSSDRISVFLMRELDETTMSLIVALVVRKIFEVRGMAWENEEHAKRMKAKSEHLKMSDPEQARKLSQSAEDLEKEARSRGIPKGWIIFDEAQVFCPSQGYVASKEVLIDIAKRGRVLGLSMAAATQQPSALSSKFISQRDIIITHQSWSKK